MSHIFISYRRSDTTAVARQVADRLRQRYGPESVFHDLKTIVPGQQFGRLILERLKQVDIVIALIGVHWQQVDSTGRTRLADPEDWVRVELRTALDCGVQIVPVLVGGAKMPTPETLPEDLRGLCHLNATILDDGRDFDRDLERLLDDIERLQGTYFGRQLELRQGVGADPLKSSRPSGVLLDRHYSYLLGNYCAEPGSMRANSLAKYDEMFDMLARAILFFDRLYIEQSYASSIAWTLNRRDSEAFADVFTTFTFSALPMSLQDRCLLAEVIEVDLRDPHFGREIELYYEGRPLKGNDSRELVTYINNVVFAAYFQRWSILAWAPRARLFAYKLSRLNRFWNASEPLDIVRHAIDIAVPEFSPRSISELNQLRQDVTVIDFREKIWDLMLRIVTDDLPDSKALIQDEFRKASRLLASKFRNEAKRPIQVLAPGSVPLPVNAGISISSDMAASLAGKPYSWLLFLYGAASDGTP